MAQHDAARLFPCQSFKLNAQIVADSAQSRCALMVAAFLINQIAANFHCAFSRDDDAKLRAASLSLGYFLCHRFYGERNFGK
jgi:hypothetical protein